MDTCSLSSADHGVFPPRVEVPRAYNAAHDLLERNLRALRGSKVAYIDDAGSYTYAELAQRVNRFANALKALGLQYEQRVLLCLQDGIDFPVGFLGCIKAGVVPVAVNTMVTASDLSYMLEDSRAVLAIVSAPLLGGFAATLRQARHLRRVVVSGGGAGESLTELLAEQSDVCDPAPTTCDDMCFWLYSSGSTGAPKATVHAHASLVMTAEMYARAVVGFCEADVVFSVSKLPFAYGLGNSLTFPLAVGATAILMGERPTAAAIIARLRQHSPTVLCSIPTAFASVLAHQELPAKDEMRLRICVSAAEALPEEIGRSWRQHFGVDILDGIGSTEMLHIYLSNRQGDVRYGTTGLPVPGYEVRLVGDDGQTPPQGVSGELQVRGPSAALFYWNNRDKTRATFNGEWLRTGDRFIQRDDGFFVHQGRVDEMLKVGGLYVSPLEVESVLVRHVAVLEAAVAGRSDSDGLTKPAAFVVLKPGFAVTEAELQQFVKAHLAPYKYPRWIDFVPELPRTPTGKIQRFRLRDPDRAS